MPDVSEADFAAADHDTLELILKEGDKRLAAQVTLMLAADSRANAVLASATAMAAAAFGVAASELGRGSALSSLFIGAGAFAVVATMAAFAAVAALWPVGIRPQGSSPAIFVDDIKESQSLSATQAQLASFLVARINENRACAARLTRWIRVAMAALATAPIIGGAVGAYSSGGNLRWIGLGLGMIGVGGLLFFSLKR